MSDFQYLTFNIIHDIINPYSNGSNGSQGKVSVKKCIYPKLPYPSNKGGLEKRFIEESTAAGLDGLKGHRSVGGMRASMYNAFPEEGVDALVAFMRDFERKHG